jgi:hypothetical protein
MYSFTGSPIMTLISQRMIDDRFVCITRRHSHEYDEDFIVGIQHDGQIKRLIVDMTGHEWVDYNWDLIELALDNKREDMKAIVFLLKKLNEHQISQLEKQIENKIKAQPKN